MATTSDLRRALSASRFETLCALHAGDVIRGLARGLGHDIRNAVQILALLEGGGDDRFTTDLERAVDQFVDVAQILSRFGSLTTALPESIHPRALLDQIQALAMRQRALPAIPVRITSAANLPALYAVEDHLILALLALVTNAKEAMPEGTGAEIVLDGRPTDLGVVFRVIDRGPGLAADARAESFEPFFTTKGPQHLGLGLPVALGLVSRAGGTLTLEQAPDGPGTAAEIRLPAVGPRR